jgi:hypothetical protein
MKHIDTRVIYHNITTTRMAAPAEASSSAGQLYTASSLVDSFLKCIETNKIERRHFVPRIPKPGEALGVNPFESAGIDIAQTFMASSRNNHVCLPEYDALLRHTYGNTNMAHRLIGAFDTLNELAMTREQKEQRDTIVRFAQESARHALIAKR